MAEVNPRDYYLEVDIYPYPNPALTQVLVGDQMGAIIGDYTAKVLAVYTSRMADRPRIGDKHPGLSLENTSASVHIGGFRNDRVVGEITVDVPYAAADEFGRHAYNPYAGHHDLRDSLYSILPPL